MSQADREIAQLRDELAQARRQFADFLHDLPDALLEITDFWNPRLSYMNRMALLLFGYSESDFEAGIAIPDLFADGEYDRALEIIKGYILENLQEKQEYVPLNKQQLYEFRMRRKDGSIFYSETQTAFVLDEEGAPVSMRTLIRDVTERKQMEDNLRNLSAYLRSLREEERTRISRQIHDELGQSLTALNMELSWMEGQLRADQIEVQERIKSMGRLIDSLIERMHQISSELRPGILDQLGLLSAIEWELNNFENRSGLQCEVNTRPQELDIDMERATTLYRVLKEALTNVARHAAASQVEINLLKQNGELVLEIRDDGIGIDETKISNLKSFGIIGMRERMNEWRGEVTITGEKNKGTVVKATMPLKYS